MRFRVDASLPRLAMSMLRQLGHDAADVRDIGLRSAADDAIAAHARSNQQALPEWMDLLVRAPIFELEIRHVIGAVLEPHDDLPVGACPGLTERQRASR